MSEPLDLFDSDELTALAGADLEKNDFEAALRKLKTVTARRDAPDAAFGMIARIYAQLQLWDKACKAFERYLKMVPDAVNESFQLGMVYFDMGQRDKAVDLWGELLSRQPTHPPALFFSALAHAEMGSRTEAQRHLDVLLKSAPADNLYFGRGKELLQALERGASFGKASMGPTHGTEH